jgi:hypothetical protein
MNSYDSVTSYRRPVIRVILGATALMFIFGASVSAAQGIDPSVLTTQATVGPLALADAPAVAPSDEVLELVAQIEERDHQIAVLQEQLAFVRQAQLSSEVFAGEQANEISALEASGAVRAEANAEGLRQWRAGYTLGGGKNFGAFERTILPCESGNEPNPDVAVGRTDDWGRSQINRPTWKKRFESLTGVEFEENIVNPILNGFMAAHVEQEQGLNAWTCWRKR